MKKHIIIPLTLVVAAVIVGGSTLTVYYSNNPQVAQNVETSSGEAAIYAVSIGADQTAAAGSNSRVVTWQTASYPAGGTVNINLIRKISSEPVSYELVRTLAVGTANDGSETWTPEANEMTGDLYIEVVCGNSSVAAGCRSSQPVKAF